MPRLVSCSLFAALSLAAAPCVGAQAPSTIDPAALDAAVTAPASDARSVLTSTLTTERALTAAATLGLEADEVVARVAALDDVEADRLAQRVLAGGDTITISATALIIILLLIILITD